MLRKFVLFLVGASLFMAGAFTGLTLAIIAMSEVHPDIGIAWNAITTKHVGGTPSETVIKHGAIRGMIASLDDPFSRYVTPEEAKREAEEDSGAFGGVGLTLEKDETGVVVRSAIDGAPGARAGIRKGDRIVAVDGMDIAKMELPDVVGRIRGKRGTTVVLTMSRGDATTRHEVVRDIVQVVSVTSEMRGVRGVPVAIIRIDQFHHDTDDRFGEATGKAIGEGAQAIIVDLRDNPGGSLDAVLKTSCRWLGDETSAVIRFKDKPLIPAHEPCAPLLEGIPTVVLVNGHSASASEILAGALQDAKAATIVGEKTFGKGVGQSQVPLTDGSLLWLTEFEWLTPKGRSIHKKGITPDIIVPSPAEAKPGMPAHEDADSLPDPHMDKALELLVPPR